jgi:hypothetical protein
MTLACQADYLKKGEPWLINNEDAKRVIKRRDQEGLTDDFVLCIMGMWITIH